MSACARENRGVSSHDLDVGLLSPVWAGTHAAALTSDTAILAALLDVEIALAKAQAPSSVSERIEKLARSWKLEPTEIAAAARTSGSPVLAVHAKLRQALDDEAAGWLHRGATSQDVFDTTLVLIAKRTVAHLIGDAHACCERLIDLANMHRATVMVGRTMTQHAAPTTLGLKFAGWLLAIASATHRLKREAAALPVQLGGTVGTLAAFQQASGARKLVEKLALALDLQAPIIPWHVLRAPVTRLGDALVTLSDALGTAAANISILARPEIGELDDGAGSGTSALPHKRNPVRSILVSVAARQAPSLGAQLHACAVTVDERPDGAWHAEWPALRELLRVVGGQVETAKSMFEHLRVFPDRIDRNLLLSGETLASERVAARFAEEIGITKTTILVNQWLTKRASLTELIANEPGLKAITPAVLEALTDPHSATGDAVKLVDRAVAAAKTELA